MNKYLLAQPVCLNYDALKMLLKQATNLFTGNESCFEQFEECLYLRKDRNYIVNKFLLTQPMC